MKKSNIKIGGEYAVDAHGKPTPDRYYARELRRVVVLDTNSEPPVSKWASYSGGRSKAHKTIFVRELDPQTGEPLVIEEDGSDKGKAITYKLGGVNFFSTWEDELERRAEVVRAERRRKEAEEEHKQVVHTTLDRYEEAFHGLEAGGHKSFGATRGEREPLLQTLRDIFEKRHSQTITVDLQTFADLGERIRTLNEIVRQNALIQEEPEPDE